MPRETLPARLPRIELQDSPQAVLGGGLSALVALLCALAAWVALPMQHGLAAGLPMALLANLVCAVILVWIHRRFSSDGPWLIVEDEGLRFPRLAGLLIPWEDVEGATFGWSRDLRIHVREPRRYLEGLPWIDRIMRWYARILHGTFFAFDFQDLETPIRVLCQEIEFRAKRARRAALPAPSGDSKKKAPDADAAEEAGSPWELHQLNG